MDSLRARPRLKPTTTTSSPQLQGHPRRCNYPKQQRADPKLGRRVLLGTWREEVGEQLFYQASSTANSREEASLILKVQQRSA